MRWSPAVMFGFMRGNVLVLSISGALGMFCRGMVFPYAPLFILSLGGQPAEIGFIYALGPLGGLIVFPLAGYLADHTSRARIIAFTGYFSSAIFLLFIFAQSWHWVALGILLQGFAVLQFPASSALVADSLPPHSRGRGMATMQTVSGVPAILAPYAAGLLLDAHGIDAGMRILYTVMAVAYALSATINLLFIKEPARQPIEKLEMAQASVAFKRSYTGIPALLRGFPPTLRALSVIIILGFIVNGLASPFWVVYAKTQIGLSAAQWGLVLLVESSLGHLVRIPAGFLTDRFGRTRFILGALLVGGACMPLFVFAGTLAQVMAIRCLVALCMAFFGPACGALLADSTPRDIRGRVMAAIGRGSVMIGAASGGTGGPGVGFLISVPLGLAALVGGYLYEWNPASPWGLVLLFSILALVLAAIFVRDPKKAEI